MIFCEGECRTWYHVECMKYDDVEVERINNLDSWYCDKCAQIRNLAKGEKVSSKRRKTNDNETYN